MQNSPDIKLIALDLDGTALDEQSRLSEETKEALTRAKEAGVHVVIDTGRPFCALPSDVVSFDAIEYVIVSNGARIVHLPSGKLLHSSCHSPESVDKLYEILSRENFLVEVFTGGNAFMDQSYRVNIERYGLSTGRNEYLMATRKGVPDILAFLKEHRTQIESVMINFNNDADKARIRKLLEDLNLCSVTTSMKANLELGALHTNKASGLDVLGKILDISTDNMMACGDSPNDLEMLREAGFAVAMGNASPEVISEADFVTKSNIEHGVAHAVYKYVLKTEMA